MSEPKEFDEIIHCERIGDSLLYNHYVVGELVRCKDCKFWNRYDDVQVIGSCNRYGDIYNKREADFCSWGERKDKE